jgi:hypothetical protein
VLGAVSSGAEVVAGGSIHVYGTLRGRAMAGANFPRRGVQQPQRGEVIATTALSHRGGHSPDLGAGRSNLAQ